MLVEQIERVEGTKKEWEANKFFSKATKPIHPVVHRALELKELELDVQAWTDDFSQRLTDEEQNYLKTVLASHSSDEDKHELVLGYLSEYWGGVEVSDQAKEIITMWRELPGDLMAKKTFLEAGVFFSLLPLITRYSDYDVYTSRVADWILTDEVRHVKVARTLIRQFNIKVNPAVLEAIEKTIRFLLQGEPEEVISRWVKRSNDIAIKGSCDDFAEESYRVVAGHFDAKHRNNISNGYSY